MLGDHLVFPILLSTDLARSREFYHDTLGLEILRQDEERIIFRCGAGSQLAVTRSTTGTADRQTQLAWRVPDLRAELADLRPGESASRPTMRPTRRRTRTGSPTWASPGRPGSSIRARMPWPSSSRREARPVQRS